MGVLSDWSARKVTSAATLTERLYRPNYGTLEVEITIDDSKVYPRRWNVSMKQDVMLDTDSIDEICLVNGKSCQHMQAPESAK